MDIYSIFYGVTRLIWVIKYFYFPLLEEYNVIKVVGLRKGGGEIFQFDGMIDI